MSILPLKFLVFAFSLAGSLAAQPLVITSVNPLRSLVRDLAADTVITHSLVQQSAHEHVAEITPQQAIDLSKADLIVLVGLGQEPWSDSLPQASRAKILEFASSQKIISGDQHLWLDPVLVANFIPALTKRLCEINSARCQDYLSRSSQIQSELTQLDSELQRRFAALKNTSIIFYHPAWIRFADRYNLKVIATLTATGDEEPSARNLIELARTAKGIPVVVEPSTPQQVMERLPELLGSKIVTLDPQAGQENGSVSYLDFIDINSQRLLKALQEQK